MNVRGVSLNYKIIGNQGPWMVLSPGGHRNMYQYKVAVAF